MFLGIVTIENGEGDVTSICSVKSRPDLLYCSLAENVYLYDLRQFSKPIEKLTFNEDEINHITLNENEEFLASCNDSGHVKIYSLMNKSVFKTLRKHTNICSSVAFRPKRPWDIISASYDQRIIQWDFSRGKPINNIDIREVGISDKFDNYIVNPPFIHSIAISKTGAFLACGVENAVVQVFDASKRTLSFVKSLQRHTTSVSNVHFPEFAENILVSGGGDGLCNIWDLENTDLNQKSKDCQQQNSGASSLNDGLLGKSSSQPCYSIQHTEKINWITSGRSASQKFIIVTDVSENATVYAFPEF